LTYIFLAGSESEDDEKIFKKIFQRANAVGGQRFCSHRAGVGFDLHP
jgi:hypothetical protein